MTAQRSNSHRERGSVMLESSLVLVIFVSLLVGITDIGQFLFQHQTIAERVRSALRYGVVTYDPAAIRNVVLYGEAVPAQGASPSFDMTPEMVSIQRVDINQPADRLMITVSNYPVRFFTPFIAKSAIGRPITGVQPMEVGNLP